MINKIISDLRDVSRPDRIAIISSFFKTGDDEYGAGDQFIGAYVPDIRKVALKHKTAALNDVERLMRSNIHEERFLGLLILIHKFNDAPEKIYNFYIKHITGVNNWDLVDLSADKIIGEFLHDKNKDLIYRFAGSENLWERRIAIVSTFAFIKRNHFDDTLKIAEALLMDKHDLIHKSVGWMLREVGKRDQRIEEDFLKKHYRTMPRTMLRYAIERFEKTKKEFYMKK